MDLRCKLGLHDDMTAQARLVSGKPGLGLIFVCKKCGSLRTWSWSGDVIIPKFLTELSQDIKQNSKTEEIHWLKLDHITFLLIAPTVLFDLKAAALGLWVIALVYDIHEERVKEKK